jgi:DNA-binding response OmpR family regulator
MVKILVVDDPHVNDALSGALPLRWEAATIVSAADGDEALRLFFGENPDVVVLDVSSPCLSGFEVLRQIRRVSDVPVLILSTLGHETDQVRGLQLGADDYVVKPFGAPVLMARIRAVLRRTERLAVTDSIPDFGAAGLAINYEGRRVMVNGHAIDLTPVEFKLLAHLARNAGQVLTHEVLRDQIWGPDSYRTDEHLRVYISRLRSKIRQAGGPQCIETVRTVGYRLVRPRMDASVEHCA